MIVEQRLSFAAKKAPGLPKLRDIPRRIQEDSCNETQEPDLLFAYADADSLTVELAELYSYSEQDEFLTNYECFNEFAKSYNLPIMWLKTSSMERNVFVQCLLEGLELADIDKRRQTVRAFLYLLQGCYLELHEDEFNSAEKNNNGTVLSNDYESSQSCHNSHLLRTIRENAYFFYEHGVFSALCSQLSMYVDDCSTNVSAGAAQASRTATMSDSADLRAVLSALYTIVECIRRDPLGDDVPHSGQSPPCKMSRDDEERLVQLRKNFLEELSLPICGDLSLPLMLFNMVTRFCAGTASHYPMRKVLLLLWKAILCWLGGWAELRQLKDAARETANLKPYPEDTIEVARLMRAAPPPLLPHIGESMDMPQGMEPRRVPPLAKRQFACAPDDSGDDGEETKDEMDSDSAIDSSDDKAEDKSGNSCAFVSSSYETTSGESNISGDSNNGESSKGESDQVKDQSASSSDGTRIKIIPGRGRTRAGAVTEDEDGNIGPECFASSSEEAPRSDSPRPRSQEIHLKRTQSPAPAVQQPQYIRNLPWSPKIREKDIEAFLEQERAKFFGFSMPSDKTTLTGLPRPIHESVDALRKHVFVSTAELQIRREEQLNRYPFSQPEQEIPETPAELFYRMLLPQLPHYLIALLKILLAAAPHSKAKSDAINILVDMIPGALAKDAPFEKIVLETIDVGRHKEVIVKAVSSILLLMLKHFKVNHVYQYEHVAQHLTFANCIPLILKFFDQNILQYVQSRHEVPELNYPAVVLYLGKHKSFPGVDLESVNPTTTSATNTASNNKASCANGGFLWRNLFSAINLLRLLNKLTKWKHSRTMMLVVFKSAPILKRALRVRHILLQLFALKLLKMQAKYLGRQWRKTNMEIMSAIYSKVRHRLNDDWAYGNETNAKPWDFQEEESILRNNIEKFNMRRYGDMNFMSASSMCNSTSVVNRGDSFGDSKGLFNNWPWATTVNGPCGPVVLNAGSCSDPDYQSYDNNLCSVLGAAPCPLTEQFKLGYEKWLQREVYKATIDWDCLLTFTKGCAELVPTAETSNQR